MAAGEHQRQQVVADLVVGRRRRGRRRPSPSSPRARGRPLRACARRCVARRARSIARFFAVAISQAPGLSGTPVARPALERRDQRVLRQVLGQPDVADQPRQAGDEAGGLDPPDRLDRRPGIGRRRQLSRPRRRVEVRVVVERLLHLGGEVLHFEDRPHLDPAVARRGSASPTRPPPRSSAPG